MSEPPILLSEASDPVIKYIPDFLRLFDEATLWLGRQGRTGQWGEGAPSSNPDFLRRTTSFLESARERNMTMIFARADEGSPIIGILAYNEAPTPDSGVPPIGEREIYVHLLLTTRDPGYRGLGQRLLVEAKEEARRRDINMLRLSCYAGEDGKLIRAYEKMGFRKNPDEVVFGPDYGGRGPWPKMVMEMKLEAVSNCGNLDSAQVETEGVV